MFRVGPSARSRALEIGALIAILVALVTDKWNRDLDRPLGWDESIYALGGRAILDGDASTITVSAHRPVGMRVLAIPGILVGGTERALRGTMLMWTVLAVIAFWFLGRRTFGRWSILCALGLLMTAPAVLSQSGEVMNDLPSLGLLCLTLHVLGCELEREGGPSWHLLWVAPLAAATFYVRYGALLPLVLGGLAAIALWWREIVARRGIALVTLGLLVLLFAPHLVAALRTTGSPVGIITLSAKVAGRKYIGDGLIYYLSNWFSKPGWAVGSAMAIGAAFGVFLLIRWARARQGDRASTVTENDRDSVRPLLFLWIVAVGHLIAVGFTAHGQYRFLFPSVFFFTGLGTHALGRLIPRRLLTSRVVMSGLTVALLSGLAHQHWVLRAPGRHRGVWWQSSVLKLGSDRIRTDGHGPCSVLTNEVWRVAWYSGCQASRLTGRATDLARLTGDRRYILLFQKGHAMPRKRDRRKLLAAARAVVVAHMEDPYGGGNDAVLYRVEGPARTVSP